MSAPFWVRMPSAMTHLVRVRVRGRVRHRVEVRIRIRVKARVSEDRPPLLGR